MAGLCMRVGWLVRGLWVRVVVGKSEDTEGIWDP